MKPATLHELPLVGLMLGDMTGIGPEICARLLDSKVLNDVARIAVVGDARVFELGCKDAGVQPAWRSYQQMADIDWSDPSIAVVDLGNIDPALIPRGEMSALSGRLTGDTLKHMIDLAGAGELDAIFLKALKGEYDGVVMMYHDQGQIATKLLGFNKGVTVTAGLSAIFTTPAHGTAFDIVGQGKADTGALEQALRIGARMAVAKKALA